MISKNISHAKAELSALVNAALNGEDVTICKDGVPAVRLVPVRPILGEDPCRYLPELSAQARDDFMAPLGEDAWGAWSDDGSP
jgi:prevent-host-death family protein